MLYAFAYLFDRIFIHPQYVLIEYFVQLLFGEAGAGKRLPERTHALGAGQLLVGLYAVKIASQAQNLYTAHGYDMLRMADYSGYGAGFPPENPHRNSVP